MVVRKCDKFNQNNCRFNSDSCWFLHEQNHKDSKDDSVDKNDEEIPKEEENVSPVFQKSPWNLKPPFKNTMKKQKLE